MTLLQQIASTRIQENIALVRALLEDKLYLETVWQVSEAMSGALSAGHKILFFGNGGSAADAQHLAAELAGRFLADRRSLPGIALTTNTSALTAIGNDYSFEDVFARQVEGLGEPAISHLASPQAATQRMCCAPWTSPPGNK